MLAASNSGIFLADVSAGDAVVSGDRLGRVIDIHGRTITEWRARDPGWVMALKSRSPVRAGDPVLCLAAADTDAPDF